MAASLTGRGRQLFSGDPDRGVWKEPGVALAGYTGLSIEQVESTYLCAYGGFLWPSRPDHGVWRHVLHMSDGKRLKNYFGLQYCPTCLATDHVPYFRKRWRLAFVVACDLHGCMLRDRCPHCRSPVQPNLCDVGQKWLDRAPGITDCYGCHSSLLISSGAVQADLSKFQGLLLTTLERGWISLAGRCVHSIMFFEGFRMLLSFLDDEQKSESLAASLNLRPLAPEKSSGRRSRYGGIETVALPGRLRLISITTELFKNWPVHAMELLKKSAVSSREVFAFNRGAVKTVPFWLWQPIKFAIDRTPYVASDSELSNAAAYLYRHKPDAGVHELCELMNMNTRSNIRVSRALSRVKSPHA